MNIKKEYNKTEEKIIQAALDVIEEKAISGVRLRSIAEKADVYPANLHYYYKSKKELLLAAQKKVASYCISFRNKERIHAEDTVESQLDVFIKQKQNFIEKEEKYDYAEIDFWIQSRFDYDFSKEFEKSFLTWQKELAEFVETYAPQIPSRKKKLIPIVIISLLEGATIQFHRKRQGEVSLTEYFDYCKEIIMRELGK